MTPLESALRITLQNLCNEYPNQSTKEHKYALAEVIGLYAKKYEAVAGKRWTDSEGRGIVDYLIQPMKRGKD